MHHFTTHYRFSAAQAPSAKAASSGVKTAATLLVFANRISIGYLAGGQANAKEDRCEYTERKEWQIHDHWPFFRGVA